MNHRPLIFDVSATEALFNAHPWLFAYLEAAERGELLVLFPSAVIAETQDKTPSAWDAVLLAEGVDVLDLGLDAALTVAQMDAALPLSVRHVMYEAEQVGGLVVTCERDWYPPGVPLLAF